MTDLSASVVTYRSDPVELGRTLASFAAAADRARAAGLVTRVTIWLVDNGGNDSAQLDETLAQAFAPYRGWLSSATLRGHGNVGYGGGHNLALTQSGARFHLVLNPDVVLEADALGEGLRYLDRHPAVGLITPRAHGTDGERQYLCKRYPSVLVLGLRGFAPSALRRPFRRLLDRYEMRDLPEDSPNSPIPIASGCFMLCRREPLAAIGGFSPDYFLYFEDFDLSLRLARRTGIAYVPSVRITHAGGEAGAKGWAHRRMFIRSGVMFFRRHGWRLW